MAVTKESGEAAGKGGPPAMTETPWIKFYPADFLNGVAELRPNEMAVYTIVLMRIYDEDAPIPYDPAKISRRCNMRRPACENALSALADAGKLIIENGVIDNKRARKERGKRSETRAKQSCNAHKRWSDGTEKGNKINGTAMPSQCQTDATHMPTRSQKPDTRSQKEEPPNPPDDLSEAVSDWNDLAEQTGLPKIARLTPARAKKLRRRLDDCDGINGWAAAMEKIRGSPFLLGKNERGWRADFDFVLQEKSFTKLMEGGYDRKKSTDSDDAKRILAATVARRMEAGRGSDGPEGGSPCEPGGGEGRDAGGRRDGNRQGTGQADDDFPHPRLVGGRQ